MQISSPRAPRSSVHRSSSSRSRSSPRRQRIRPFSGGAHIDQPDYEGPSEPATIPPNLHDPSTAINLDPRIGAFDAGGETEQPEIAPARRRFVGGFVGNLKNWAQQKAGVSQPVRDSGIAYPDPAVVYEDGPEGDYAAVPRADMEGHYYDIETIPEEQEPTPTHSQVYRHGVYSTPVPSQRYASPTSQLDRVSGERYVDQDIPPHTRQESDSSVSETVHTTQEQYDGTTIMNHDMQMPHQYADYAYGTPQMGPGPPQEGGYGKPNSDALPEGPESLWQRFQRFLQAVNDLPWVAPDRVTVDFIPRNARDRFPPSEYGSPLPRTSPRPRSGGSRASWYNNTNPVADFGMTPAPNMAMSVAGSNKEGYLSPMGGYQSPKSGFPSPQVGYQGEYTSSPYPNNFTPVPFSPRSTSSRRQASTIGSPQRVPVPRYTPDIDGPPGSGTYFTPMRYPNGYVPYDQVGAQTQTYMYTGSSVASSQIALP
ncbi:unnamed protein product [Mycena citricolor]|uniref:Uncharacterized protein n=1 Tax=Mycena citricolor TaxID=2018698 RepID=A0AAD2K517_9AGAR|nr:unnamed protein product [Mycena citricolor]